MHGVFLSNETQQKQGLVIHPQAGWPPDHEGWHATHAQLLKSVADAQAKLLAAQNETNDRLALLEKLCNPELEVKALMGISGRLERMDRDLRVLIAQTQETVRSCHGNISGRLVEFEALLAPPRRQVEKLRPKRIVKRAVERKQRKRTP